MAQLGLDTSVGEWVVHCPQTSRAFEEMQVDYCCGGDKSLQQACLDKQLDPQQVLSQLEAIITSPDIVQAENWSSASLSQLCDHIEASHHAYLRKELPRLTELIAKVIAAHANRHPELQDVQRVFAELRQELEPHMMKEERVLFPAIRHVEKSSKPNHFPFGSLANPVACLEHEHDAAGAALSKLRQLTAGYHAPDDACRTYRVMTDALAHLEADMHQHVHKENNILFPRAVRMEAKLAQ